MEDAKDFDIIDQALEFRVNRDFCPKNHVHQPIGSSTPVRRSSTVDGDHSGYKYLGVPLSLFSPNLLAPKICQYV